MPRFPFGYAPASMWQAATQALPWLEPAVPLFALALIVSSLGFYRLVYFVSLGYGFSISAMALWTLWRVRLDLDPLVGAHLVLLAVYGLRLSGYLVSRERSPAYRKELADVQSRAVGIGPGKKLGIWLGVSVLYVLMFSPGLFNVLARGTGGPSPVVVGIGVAVMALGLLLESASDWQKSAYKKTHPDRYCDVGLYRLVRCPNYLGEIVFWIGSFVAGLSAYGGVGQWVSAAIGLVCIVLIMIGSTKRLERKQEERYGARADFQEYTRTVPVLFPFVPVYTLRNVRVYLE